MEKKVHDPTGVSNYTVFKQLETLRNILSILCAFTCRGFLPD